MTDADRRAVALLSRNGYAVVVPVKGFWLSGGERIAQITIQRMVALGYATRDPKQPRKRVLATGRSKADARPEDLPAELGDSVRWPDEVVAARRSDDDEWGYDTGWRPPDHRELNDRPVPLDRALKDEEY